MADLTTNGKGPQDEATALFALREAEALPERPKGKPRHAYVALPQWRGSAPKLSKGLGAARRF
jgi:hypothetical protein